MSPRFRPEDVDAVRERADLVEVISDHMRLRQAGRAYKGLCPFHQEKTPSFTVDRDKGLYHCFGCGAGGSVFTFLQELEGLSFTEAVEQLAGRYGIELREAGGTARKTSPRSRLLALHEAALEHYRDQLTGRDGARVREYLLSRNMAEELWERYRIGFGGWGRDNLTRTLVRKAFSVEELITGGLAHRDARGVRDTFYGRLLFPIFDPSDRPVGFGGRVLPPDHRRQGAPEGPKYLNSRETPLFKKSKVLYGVNWARGEIIRKRRLVLVEGYTDVIALQSAGITEAVATCGTSLTEQHMKEISTRFGDVQIVLCLDADAAGQAAVARDRTEELAERFSPGELVGGTGWIPVGKGWLPEVYVADLPSGTDPAEFVEQKGAEGIERVLEQTVPLVEFLLRRAVAGNDLTSPEGRTAAVRKGAEILGQVGDSLLRHEYTLSLAGRVGVDPYEVGRVVSSRTGRSDRRPPPAPSASQPRPLSGHHRVEREALRAITARPGLLEHGELAPIEDDFTLPLHRTLFRLFVQQPRRDDRIELGTLVTAVVDDDIRRMISELAVGETVPEEAARELLVRLKEFSLSRQIDERKERLRSLDPEREAAAYDALFEELLRLEKQKRALHSGATA